MGGNVTCRAGKAISGLSYKDAGVDIDAGERLVEAIRPLARATRRPGVVDDLGGFGALFDLRAAGFVDPLLVAATDGVGTKLKLAIACDRHDTVGIDLVAMSVNDLICTGGEPLVFLDYVAMHADDPALTVQLVKGISDGCKLAGCALGGGETAILPDFYAPGDFDLAGFCTGVVERSGVIDGRHIEPGDALVGLASSGVHSNGYSLVRKIVFDAAKLTVTDPGPEPGKTVGDVLLEPTRIYVKPVLAILRHYPVKKRVVSGLANITGGGLGDNLGRILPPGRRAVVRRGTWPVPAVFPWLQTLGNVPPDEMDKVFNGGVGFVVVCRPHFADSIVKQLDREGVPATRIGEIVEGEAGVQIG